MAYKQPKSFLSELKDEVDDSMEQERLAKLLATYEGEDRLVDMQELMRKVEENKKDSKAFTTQIKTLDNIIPGFEPGNLITLSGATGNGKTLFAQTLTRNFSKQEIPSVWFSYEVSDEEFITPFGKNLPLAYVPNMLTETRVQWIEQRILEGIVKYDIKAVFIDHLHYLVSLSESKGGKSAFSLIIGGIMRELKRIAKTYGIVIFLISHIRKGNSNETPTIDDLRDSTFQGQESDFVIFVHRLKEDGEWTDKSKVYVEKNRKTGKMGSVTMIKNGNLLEEYDLLKHELDTIHTEDEEEEDGAIEALFGA